MSSIDLHQQDWDWGNAVARLDLRCLRLLPLGAGHATARA